MTYHYTLDDTTPTIDLIPDTDFQELMNEQKHIEYIETLVNEEEKTQDYWESNFNNAYHL